MSSYIAVVMRCGPEVSLCVVLQVVYDDSSADWMWMGVERVRLLITSGEELQRPSAGTLQALSRR